MANNSKSLLPLLIHLILLSLLSYSILAISRDNICKSTQFPSYCTSILPNDDADIHDFGLFSVRKSLAQSQRFHNSVQNHLRGSSDNLLEPPAILALEDCHELVSLSIDLLEGSIGTVNGTNQVLPMWQAEDLQTSLSAVLTNIQTCLEVLESTPSAETLKNDMSQIISNDTKLHSVSLALCTQGWVPKETSTTMVPFLPPSWITTRQHAEASRKVRLPMMKVVPDRNRAIFESLLLNKVVMLDPLWGHDHEGIRICDFVVVSKKGSWNFTTINEAIAATPNNTDACDGYFLIYVMAGVYEEYVSVDKDKKCVFLLGEGIDQTIITGNRSVVDGWTTFHSATLTVTGTGFLAANITVRNTAGPSKHQAVAVRNSADLSTFYRCSFEAYQDTLYAHTLRQFYRNCDIYGTVDFVFGNATAVLQNCNIYARLPLKGQFNVITTHGRTDPNQNTGISIHNCYIAPTIDLAAANAAAEDGNGTFTKTYLGRPWQEYSRIVHMQSFVDGFVDPAGWRAWNESDFALDTLYFAEFDNWGPGSDTSNRVNWTGYHVINAFEAVQFTVSRFLLGDFWLPQRGVPYNGGLIW